VRSLSKELKGNYKMSVTFRQATQQNINRAIEKAKALKPHVLVKGFNDFVVYGSKGDRYSVKFSGKGEDFTAHCTCKASERELVCYHIASCAPIYKQQVSERASARVCAGCGADSEQDDTCTCVAMLAVEPNPVMCKVCNEAEEEINGLCKPCMDAKVREDFTDLFGSL
jgi:hypothetical protein